MTREELVERAPYWSRSPAPGLVRLDYTRADLETGETVACVVYVKTVAEGRALLAMWSELTGRWAYSPR